MMRGYMIRKFLTACAVVLASAAALGQSVLSGTVSNPDGSGFNGRLIFSLAQNASVNSTSPCTGPLLIVPTESVSVVVSNGALVSPPTLVSSSCTVPVGIPYNVTALDSNGNVAFTDQWLISGNPFNVGTAVSSGTVPVVSYQGPWVSTQTYNVGDMVGYGAPTMAIYISVVSSNLNNTPATSPSDWQLLGATGGSAFTGGLGSSYQDVAEIAAPSNPSSGHDRLYLSSSTHLMACLTSAGGSCMPSGSGGDTITSPHSTLGIGGSSSNTTLDVLGAAGEILAGATPALTYSPQFGVDNSHAGTLALANGGANAHTVFGSAATVTNTILGPATVVSNGDLMYCVVSSTSCTLTDTGYPYNAIPNADLAHSTISGIALGSNLAALTGAISGGAAPNSTYTGASAVTFDYHTLGAPGLAATTNTFTGTTNDFSGTSQLKLPVGAGYVSAANGELGYDSTNFNWHIWANGVDAFVAVFATSGITNGHCVEFLKSTNAWSLQDAGSVCGSGGGGDTITSPNSTLNVGGSSTATTLDLAGAAGKIMAGATPALTFSPVLGVDNTNAGTLQLANGAANAHSILGSAATTSNTVELFATVPTNLDLFYCAVSSITCTFTDTGYPYNAIPNADLANPSLTFNGVSVALGASGNGNYVTGSFTANDVAVFDGTGNRLKDSGLGIANVTQTTSTPAANQICVFGSTAKTCTPTTTLPTAAMPALTGDVTNSGGSLATTIANNAVTGAKMANNTVTATQLAAQYSKGSCSESWSGSGTSSALQSGDDALANTNCYNDSGVTRTITAVKCRASVASNTTTVNPTFGSAGTGTTILSGALTCGSSYAYSSSGTVSNASWTTGTGIDPAMAGTLTGTSITMIVEYTY